MEAFIDMKNWFCLQNLGVAFIGAFALYFQLLGNGKYVLAILPKLNPQLKENPWFAFLESILVSLIGAILAVSLTQPSSIPQAVVAGLGWTGLVSGGMRGGS